jgi:hypothetical protein
MLALPEMLALVHVTGADDYLLQVAVADTATLRSFVLRSATETTGDRNTSKPRSSTDTNIVVPWPSSTDSG